MIENKEVKVEEVKNTKAVKEVKKKLTFKEVVVADKDVVYANDDGTYFVIELAGISIPLNKKSIRRDKKTKKINASICLEWEYDLRQDDEEQTVLGSKLIAHLEEVGFVFKKAKPRPKPSSLIKIK